ncbi:HlyD family efflux transporter periplasmic adaptor subunit [Chitinophaga sp. 212800010-3]|uniref:HlyD family secretion protein n=1 Tax=unclassified Chitinophaga TaxID=2619133 RepID=UPI002DF72FCD|nr:hypothetical protein [Chitinophaga sp. 212800010-3]
MNNHPAAEKKVLLLNAEKDSFSYLSTLSSRSNFLYNFLLFVVIAIVVLLPVIRVDVTTSSAATVQSIKLKEKVIAPVAGKIVKLNITDNVNVSRGDTLLVINNTAVRTELMLTQGRKSIIEESLYDISLILRSLSHDSLLNLHTSQYQVAYQNYLDQKKQLVFKLDRITKSYERNKWLFGEKVISSNEFEESQLQYNQARSDMDLLASKFKSQMETDRYQYTTEKSNLNIKENQLVEPITNSIVIANTMGIGFKAEGIQQGSFVQPGQQLAEIVPDTGLIAACLVQPKDIGYIKTGQPVKIQIDAYNYYDWGTLKGAVFEIFKDVTVVNNQPYYMVRCKLDKNYLQLKNGYKGSLIKGMTGKTFFYVGRKSLWQLAFTKVNDWFSPEQN